MCLRRFALLLLEPVPNVSRRDFPGKGTVFEAAGSELIAKLWAPVARGEEKSALWSVAVGAGTPLPQQPHQ